MKSVITTENKPIKLWLDDIEDGALDQAKNLANLPFIFKHIAIMSDCHRGYGMPIGGVMATKGVIVPGAVGSDIGCGMCIVKTSLQEINRETIKKIMGGIRDKIPVGFNHHSKKQDEKWMPKWESSWRFGTSIVEIEYESALKQVGTLGSNNHFVEIQMGSDGYVWLMLHSGSRNLGYKVAKHYNDIAIEMNEKWFSKVPKEWELAFLPLYSDEGINYRVEMEYCVEFALSNRQLMMKRVKESVSEIFPDTKYEDIINIAHNYAAMENHFGQNVMVHRKGATRARLGEVGIIPGSQGTASYIVKGLGNKDSFESCSHGAGRKMGRKQAKRELNLATEIKRLDDMGVVHGIRNVTDLDEAAGSYKDISVVMANQADLVEIVVELKPLGVVKG